MRYRQCPCGQMVEERSTVCPACGSDISAQAVESRGAPSRQADASPAEPQTWYYMSDGRMVGPCEIEELQMSLAVGTLPSDTMVWAPGMKEWKSAGAVVDISEIAPLACAEIEVSYGIEEELEEPATSAGAASVVAALADENPIALHAHKQEHALAAAQADGGARKLIAALGDTKPHPFQRWLARMVDITIAGFVIGIVVGLIAPRSMILNSQVMSMFLALLFWAAAEPFVMTHFESTPGKALLNIHLRTAEGRSLTREQMFERSFRVWFFGLAAGFPLISVFTMAVARHKLTREGTTSWDRHGGFVVAHGEVDARRVAGIAVFVLFYVLVTVNSALP